MDTVGERVRLMRKQLEMTQEQMAQRLGIGKAALSMIETGKARLSARNKNILVQDFNVNPDWIETGEGKMFNAEPDLTSYNLRTDRSLPLQSVPLYSIGSHTSIRATTALRACELHQHPQSTQVRWCDICCWRLDVSIAQEWRYHSL